MGNNKLSIEAAIDFDQLLQLIGKLSDEQQNEVLALLKKQRLTRLMDGFEATHPGQEPDITEEEIVEEVRAYRREKAARDK